LKYIANSNLEIVTRVREKVIDIPLSSARIWQEIVNWRLSKEISLSDHRIIRFRMSADLKVSHEYKNPLSTDWDCYKTELFLGLVIGVVIFVLYKWYRKIL
jgi:hypothetical protein